MAKNILCCLVKDIYSDLIAVGTGIGNNGKSKLFSFEFKNHDNKTILKSTAVCDILEEM